MRRIQGQEEALESKAAKEQDMPVFRLNPVKNTKNKYVEQAVQPVSYTHLICAVPGHARLSGCFL